MYSPKISEVLIAHLYRRAKSEGVRMTVLVNRILAREIETWKGGDQDERQDKTDIKRDIGNF